MDSLLARQIITYGELREERPALQPPTISIKAASPRRGLPRAKTSWRDRPAGISIINSRVRRIGLRAMSTSRRSCSQSAAASPVFLYRLISALPLVEHRPARSRTRPSILRGSRLFLVLLDMVHEGSGSSGTQGRWPPLGLLQHLLSMIIALEDVPSLRILPCSMAQCPNS